MPQSALFRNSSQVSGTIYRFFASIQECGPTQRHGVSHKRHCLMLNQFCYKFKMTEIKLASGIAFLALLMLAVACGAPMQEGDTTGTPPVQDAPGETQENGFPDQRQPTDTPVGPEGGQDIPEPTPTRNDLPEQVPEDLPPVTGEAPEDVLSPIIADVAERTGAEPAEIEVLRSQSITWNDGSLGCPKPGMVYTQALVESYWVVLSYQGQEFDYRVNEHEAFFLCEEPTLPGFRRGG